MKIKYKIILIFILASILPFSIIAIYYDYISHKTIKKNISIMSNKIIEQTKSGIDDRMKSMVKNLHMSVNNQDILDTFMNLPKYDPIKASFEEEKLQKYFDTIIYNTDYLDSVIVDLYGYDTIMFGEGTEGGNISSNIKYLISKEFKNSEFYKISKDNTNEPIWISALSEDKNKIYLMKEFKYFMYARKMGVVIFVIDRKMLTDYTDIDNESINDSYAVIDNTNDYIISNESNTMLNSIYMNEKYNINNSIRTIDIEENLVSYTKLTNNWNLISIIPKEKIFREIIVTRNNTILFAFTGIIISIITAWIIAKITGNKLDKLIKRFEMVEKGDFSQYTSFKVDDEYSELEEHFNNMVNELDILIRENYICKLETKEAHLKALQYQINPHFLYNTLEIINSIATEYGAMEIRKIAQNLGKLFRYNISNDGNDITSLSKEIEHIKNYIYLHQLHLPYKLQVFFDVDYKAEDAKMLKFTLQPIIENVIKYGFKDRYSDACIEIGAIVNDNILLITISDDGVGMEKNKVNEIVKNLNTKKSESGGIGLKNIQERIRLMYGDTYGIDISSVISLGTTVKIKLPYINY